MEMKGGSRLRMGDAIGACVVRADGSIDKPHNVTDDFLPAGEIKVQVLDSKRRMKAEYIFKNLVVNQGKNSILDVYFNTGTQITTWYMGLITDTGFTSIQATDTAASHSGWSEFTGYSAGTRPSWGQGAASGQAVTNGTPVSFDITATATIRGGFIISNSTKGGTTGTLWAAALFTSSVPVNNGDQLRCTYTLST